MTTRMMRRYHMAEYMGRPAMLWETPTLAAWTKEPA